MPVLTLVGETLQARGTARVNKLLGLDDFVAKDEQDFIEKAKKAADLRKIVMCRKNLRKLVMNSALMKDYCEIARDFENIFDLAWQEYCGVAE